MKNNILWTPFFKFLIFYLLVIKNYEKNPLDLDLIIQIQSKTFKRPGGTIRMCLLDSWSIYSYWNKSDD